MVCLPKNDPLPGCCGSCGQGATDTHAIIECRPPTGTSLVLFLASFNLLNYIYQFHWQDYSDTGYLEAMQHLYDLKQEGIIKAIGLCNFDSTRTDEICTHLGPGSVVSNQVQVGSRTVKVGV